MKKAKDYDPHYGSVYKTLKDEEWQARKGAPGGGPPPKRSVAIIPRRREPVIIETRREGDIYVPKTKTSAIVEKPASKVAWLSHEPKRPKKKRGLWGRFKKKSKTWGYRRKEEGKAAGRIAWRHSGSTLEKTKAGVSRAGRTAAEFGYNLPGPFQVFTLAWQKATTTLKWLVIIVFLLAILFIPWGIFYYAGWAVAAAVMFLISLIYWIFANLFNGIASVIITIINGLVRIVMGAIIFVVEAILNLLTVDDMKWVPDPLWASRYDGNPWSHPMFMFHRSGYAVYVESHYWFEGHVMLEGSLIRYDQIANIPSLMIVSAPKWQSWMYDTLIVKMFEHIPGLSGLAAGLRELNVGIAGGFRDFVNTAEGWQVIIVGLIPIIIVICIVLYVYYKNKKYVYG